MKLTNNDFDRTQPGFRIVAAGRVADIYLYNYIGEGGVTADTFRRELEAAGDVDLIRMFVNCPGGDVFQGWAIHSQLLRHPARVNLTIDGMCASMATVIACVADRIEMHEGAMFMIHSPFDANAGDDEPDDQTKKILNDIRETMIAAYSARTGMPALKLRNMLNSGETWLTAHEAKKLGFVDHVIALRVAACAFDLKAFGYRHAPAQCGSSPSAEPAAAPAPVPIADQIRNAKLDQLKSRGILR